jgi:large subunit ribosomal protein L4
MAQVKVIDQNKKEVGEITLAPEVFEVPVRPEILNLVVRSQRAKVRAGTHSTKNRALINGGGSKPWRQKGTGRARSGSSRSPLWRHGAAIFGPQPRSYEFKVNKKVRRLALRMALSSRVLEEGAMLVVRGFEVPEIKTKKFVEIAKTLGLKKALIVLPKEDNNLALSARNIPGIKVLLHDQLNVFDVLRYPQLVLLEDAAKAVEERLK